MDNEKGVLANTIRLATEMARRRAARDYVPEYIDDGADDPDDWTYAERVAMGYEQGD